MNVPTKLAAFGALLGVVFVVAFGVGSAAGPIGADDSSTHQNDRHDSTSGDDMDTMTDMETATPGGLEISSAGYTLVPAASSLAPGAAVDYRFRIDGPDGSPVTDFELEHDKELHLIVVRRDLSGYQHVHPSRDSVGTWRVPVDLSDPGTYRVIADFTPAALGEGLTLGADLHVAGPARVTPLPAPTREAEVDGYTVSLDGDVVAGTASTLTLRVAKGGRPVTDLQPYLAAYGHLVALRSGDVAYLHVHPHGEPGDGETEPGPDVVFEASVPSTGTYRLYFDFRHDGVVRTAEFTVEAQAPVVERSTTAPDAHDEGGHS